VTDETDYFRLANHPGSLSVRPTLRHSWGSIYPRGLLLRLMESLSMRSSSLLDFLGYGWPHYFHVVFLKKGSVSVRIGRPFEYYL
jgi:hypothetical protein